MPKESLKKLTEIGVLSGMVLALSACGVSPAPPINPRAGQYKAPSGEIPAEEKNNVVQLPKTSAFDYLRMQTELVRLAAENQGGMQINARSIQNHMGAELNTWNVNETPGILLEQAVDVNSGKVGIVRGEVFIERYGKIYDSFIARNHEILQNSILVELPPPLEAAHYPEMKLSIPNWLVLSKADFAALSSGQTWVAADGANLLAFVDLLKSADLNSTVLLQRAVLDGTYVDVANPSLVVKNPVPVVPSRLILLGNEAVSVVSPDAQRSSSGLLIRPVVGPSLSLERADSSSVVDSGYLPQTMNRLFASSARLLRLQDGRVVLIGPLTPNSIVEASNGSLVPDVTGLNVVSVVPDALLNVNENAEIETQRVRIVNIMKITNAYNVISDLLGRFSGGESLSEEGIRSYFRKLLNPERVTGMFGTNGVFSNVFVGSLGPISKGINFEANVREMVKKLSGNEKDKIQQARGLEWAKELLGQRATASLLEAPQGVYFGENQLEVDPNLQTTLVLGEKVDLNLAGTGLRVIDGVQVLATASQEGNPGSPTYTINLEFPQDVTQYTELNPWDYPPSTQRDQIRHYNLGQTISTGIPTGAGTNESRPIYFNLNLPDEANVWVGVWFTTGTEQSENGKQFLSVHFASYGSLPQK